MNGVDIVLCIIPKLEPDAPTAGPAVLKSRIKAAGFSCEVLDLNIKLYNSLRESGLHDRYFFEDDALFTTNDDYEPSAEFERFYEEHRHVFMEWVGIIGDRNPRWVGLSLLSYLSRAVAVRLSELIRQHIPSASIVWGGADAQDQIYKLKDRGLIDHWIRGDGEVSIVSLLGGDTTAKGIDSIETNQIGDLESGIIPDYDDIDWSEYPEINWHKPIYVTGSKGCVKSCSFCNVYQTWPRFVYRSGSSIADELLALKQAYDRHTFLFTDSLVNGSMRAFREMMSRLRDARSSGTDLSWSGQWIIRPVSQSPESDYAMMKESGCKWLDIGLEHFSPSVRYHMGKRITDEDMWWCLDMLQKYEIGHSLLMIVGYPTETEEDHLITLDTIRRLFDGGYANRKNRDGFNYMSMAFTNTLMLEDKGPLWDMVKDEIVDYRGLHDWTYRDNTLDVRIRRFKEIHELIDTMRKRPVRNWLIERNRALYDKKAQGLIAPDAWTG